MTNHEGVQIEVGEYIVAGQGEDADYGRVIAVDGDEADVAWECGGARIAFSSGDKADVYTSQESAHQAYVARAGAYARGSERKEALARDIIGRLVSIDDGTGTLGIHVRQCIADGITDIDTIRAGWIEAGEDAAAEREHDARQG